MSRRVATAPFAALAREFELELIHLRQMIALAEEERRNLVGGEVERIDAIAAEKLAQLHALELYSRRRADCLTRQGFSADASGLAACARAAGPRGRALTAVWKQVADALATLRDLNEENAMLLRARLAAIDLPDPASPPRTARARAASPPE